MKTVAIFTVLICSAAAAPADRLFVMPADISGSIGKGNGNLILEADQLVFLASTNPQLSFSAPRTDVQAMNLDNGTVTLSFRRRLFRKRSERQDTTIRITDPNRAAFIASWVGLPPTRP